MEMDASYLTVLHPVGREPSGSLRVLQPAIAEPSRLRPNTQANTGLGVGIGAIVGIIIVFGLAMAGDARARRAGRQAPDQPIAESSAFRAASTSGGSVDRRIGRPVKGLDSPEIDDVDDREPE